MKKILIALTVIAMAFTSCKQSETVDATQAVLDNIAARTSVRAYTSEPVPDEMVETLLRAAMAAPSAMNRQPWEFVVVNDRAVLDTLAGKLRYAKMLVQAPLAIVVCAETMITHRDGSQSENGLWEHDASAATQNILLAAKALGLGAVWTAASDPERSAVVKEALNIPGTIMPLCVIPIGFPAEDPEPKDKWKPEKIHYNKW
ncbi:MAG: nitroreductase family protein [Bacteroidales bacterium]|nr:nitroreductase family protein [Bacteroidales bacterium]